MKKLITTLLLTPVAFLAQAAPLAITVGNPAYDGFNYTPGSDLAGQTTPQGLTWAAAGTSASHQPIINSGSLSYPGLAVSTGNSTSFGFASGGSGDSARLGLGGAMSSSGTTVYYSMILEVSQLGTLPSGNTGVAVAGFNNSTGTSTTQPSVIGARLCMRLTAAGSTNFNFGLDKSGSGPVWDSGSYYAGETFFIVASYTFGGGNGDSSSLWINPASSTFGAASPPSASDTTTTGSGISAVASFLLREATSTEPDLVADELRVGLAWADVTPPLPVAPSFSNLSTSQSVTYGTNSMSVSGTLSAPGPMYPASGEMITVTINGNAQTTTIDDATGDFSFNYNPSSIPASGTPYTITYSYAGDTFLSPASDTSTTLTVNQLPVILTGNRAYDGTATATFGILSVSNTVGSDNVILSSGSASLAGAAIGPEAITSVGTLALGGTSAGNYTLSGASGSVMVSIIVAAGQPAYDPFADASGTGEGSYAVGSNLIGQTSAQGLTWFSAGPTNGSQPQPVIASGNLSVLGLAAPAGNSVSYGDGNGDSARLGLNETVTNGTVYYSMAFEATSLGGLTTGGAVIAGFNNATGSQTSVPTVIGARLEVRLAGSSYNFGLDKTGSGIVWDTGTYNADQTVFLVGCYTFNTATTSDDTTSLWVNPASSTFGAASAPTPTLTSSTGPDITAAQIESFLLREGSTVEPPMIVDEVRIGFSWADVTSTGMSTLPPFSITSESIDATGTNIIISWQSVPNTTYQIIASTNLAAPLKTWSNIGGPITATSTSTSATNAITPPLNFFRVESP